jgi:hypothetical protein
MICQPELRIVASSNMAIHNYTVLNLVIEFETPLVVSLPMRYTTRAISFSDTGTPQD